MPRSRTLRDHLRAFGLTPEGDALPGAPPGAPPDAPPSSRHEQMAEAERLVREHPRKAMAEIVRGRRKLEEAKAECRRAARAAGELEKMLSGLLQSNAVLAHCEEVREDERLGPRVTCRIGSQLVDLPVHPEVTREELETVRPWEYVRVHQKEMLVVGIDRRSEALRRAHGEIVTFRGYLNGTREQVIISRAEHGEEIVTLAPELREAPLDPRAKLVLLRDDPRWAIAVAPSDNAQSRFEVPIDRIHTRLDDVAGMDPILEPLVKDIVMRVIRTDIRDDFDLLPLKGVLIYSYKPGMGKTALMRALSVWLHDLGEEHDFELVLYIVKPNELKSMWHGGDAKRVREDLCGSIAARQAAPRTRALFQLIVLDEIDSLGRRAGGDDSTPVLSSAQNDGVQALLAEIDGMVQGPPRGDNPPAHVLWVGLTNRPDMLDDALKRGGRFADLVLEVPALSVEGAEDILAVYARSESLPWYVDGEVETGLTERVIRERFLRPALARVFGSVVLRYATDGRSPTEVTSGELLAGVHYRDALNAAKRRAATRRLRNLGVPAVGVDDVVDGLREQSVTCARQMEADRQMLRRQLRLGANVNRVEIVTDP